MFNSIYNISNYMCKKNCAYSLKTSQKDRWKMVGLRVPIPWVRVQFPVGAPSLFFFSKNDSWLKCEFFTRFRFQIFHGGIPPLIMISFK